LLKNVTELIKANASIDWEIRESVQAKLKVMIKDFLESMVILQIKRKWQQN
jgi:hypothetical protein